MGWVNKDAQGADQSIGYYHLTWLSKWNRKHEIGLSLFNFTWLNKKILLIYGDYVRKPVIGQFVLRFLGS